MKPKRHQLQVNKPVFIAITILPFSYGEKITPYFAFVTRVTKNYIFTRCNELSEHKWSRKDGYAVPRDTWTSSHIEHLDLCLLNHFVNNESGGTWDGGWRPEKRKD